MDQNNDGGPDIVLQTNVVTKQSTTPPPPPQPQPQPPSSSSSSSLSPSVNIEVDASETNGKHSPAAALSPSSIILSPCSDNDRSNNGNYTDEEFDEVKRFFDKKLHVIEKYLRDRASPDIQSKLHDATDTMPKSPKLRTSSVTSDLFQQWLASSPVQVCRATYNFIQHC